MAIPSPSQLQKRANSVNAPSIPKPSTVPSPTPPPSSPSTTMGPPVPTTGSVPKPPSAPSLTDDQKAHQAWANDPRSGQGGMDIYTKTQNQRWQDANQSKDFDLMKRLQADSQKVGYVLDPYNAPAAPTQTAPNTQAPDGFADWQTKQNDAMKKLEDLMAGSFQYNPETDPRYQAYRTLSQQRAKGATQSALEEMNNRGIMNSSVTSSQLGQIQQDAEQQALAAIPQFYSEARADYQDKLRNAAEMLNFISDRSDTAFNQSRTLNRDQRGDMESDRNFERGVKESDRAFDRNVLEGDRAYDRGVVESDRVYDRGVMESDRNYDMQKAAQEWSQAFEQGKFDFQKGQQVWENAFQEKNFQRQMEEAAASRGLQWANLSQRQQEFVADQAFREKQFNLEVTKSMKGDKPKAAADYYKMLDDSMYVSPEMSQNPNNPYGDPVKTGKVKVNDPDGLESYIYSLELPNSETYQLLRRYKLIKE